MIKTTLLLLFGYAVLFTVFIVHTPHKSNVIMYDCRLSEISPDFPLEVKEQCRKMNAERNK
jgi:hypothetical protein